MSDEIEVAIFTRRPKPGHFSIEYLFQHISKALPFPFKGSLQQLPFYSSGIMSRIKAIQWAGKNQMQINHIAGDVHFLAFGLSRRKTVLTIHDCGFVDKKKGIARWLLKKLWLDWPIRRCQMVTTISEHSKDQIIKLTGCPPEKIQVVPNFVGDEFQPIQNEKENETLRLLHIGTKRNKNLQRTLLALHGIPCHLTVVGPLDNEQKEWVSKADFPIENRVDLSNKELVNLYQKSDILLFASLEEGFGLPILEAQKCGVPVVTSRLTAMPETAGRGAHFVDPTNVEEIREAVKVISQDTGYRQQLIQNGFINVERFSLVNTAEAYARVYQRVLNAG